MNLFQLRRKGEEFVLASGRRSRYKIDFDALVLGDWLALAHLLALRLPLFGAVHGVPRGGLRLADCLRDYARPSVPNLPHLVVDDVWTTGGSMRQFVANAPRSEHGWVGGVVLARGPLESWVTAYLAESPERTS